MRGRQQSRASAAHHTDGGDERARQHDRHLPLNGGRQLDHAQAAHEHRLYAACHVLKGLVDDCHAGTVGALCRWATREEIRAVGAAAGALLWRERSMGATCAASGGYWRAATSSGAKNMGTPYVSGSSAT